MNPLANNASGDLVIRGGVKVVKLTEDERAQLPGYRANNNTLEATPIEVRHSLAPQGAYVTDSLPLTPSEVGFAPSSVAHEDLRKRSHSMDGGTALEMGGDSATKRVKTSSDGDVSGVTGGASASVSQQHQQQQQVLDPENGEDAASTLSLPLQVSGENPPSTPQDTSDVSDVPVTPFTGTLSGASNGLAGAVVTVPGGGSAGSLPTEGGAASGAFVGQHDEVRPTDEHLSNWVDNLLTQNRRLVAKQKRDGPYYKQLRDQNKVLKAKLSRRDANLKGFVGESQKAVTEHQRVVTKYKKISEDDGSGGN